MIPSPFSYKRAGSVAQAATLLRENPDAKLLAGGQTLTAAMRLRLAAPSMLIDISRIPEIRFIRSDGEALILGAGTTHAEIAQSTEVRSVIPALAAMAEGIGDPAVRHKGTLGGSIANNDPAADYPAALVALDAKIETNHRVIAAEAFFTGLFSTALTEDEIVTSITFPHPDFAAYVKFHNPASHYALTGVFVAKTGNDIRVAVVGAGPCVFRVPEMEAALAVNFSRAAIAGITLPPDDMLSDLHASAEYRAHLVSVLAQRAVAEGSQ